jgi:hypothetical protein
MQVPMASVSNPDSLDYGGTLQSVKYVQFNPQRIAGGYALVSHAHATFADELGVPVEELKRTTDGRSLAALATVGL